MIEKLPELHYVISRPYFEELASTRANKNDNPYEHVMKIINDDFGLKGTVTSIRVE